jgi:hypothetical protein
MAHTPLAFDDGNAGFARGLVAGGETAAALLAAVAPQGLKSSYGGA